jgi:hypothetical protein
MNGLVGRISVPAKCLEDEIFVDALKAIVAAHKLKNGNPRSNGHFTIDFRWRSGVLEGVEVNDKVNISRKASKR